MIFLGFVCFRVRGLKSAISGLCQICAVCVSGAWVAWPGPVPESPMFPHSVKAAWIFSYVGEDMFVAILNTQTNNAVWQARWC